MCSLWGWLQILAPVVWARPSSAQSSKVCVCTRRREHSPEALGSRERLVPGWVVEAGAVRAEHTDVIQIKGIIPCICQGFPTNAFPSVCQITGPLHSSGLNKNLVINKNCHWWCAAFSWCAGCRCVIRSAKREPAEFLTPSWKIHEGYQVCAALQEIWMYLCMYEPVYFSFLYWHSFPCSASGKLMHAPSNVIPSHVGWNIPASLTWKHSILDIVRMVKKMKGSFHVAVTTSTTINSGVVF